MAKKEKVVDLNSIRYENSMQPIDWAYYTKFYPEKLQAIKEIRLDTGISLAEGKAAIEEIFARLERGEIEQREANAENKAVEYINESESTSDGTLKAIGKGALFTGGLLAYVGLGIIAKLTSDYMKKK